MRITASTRRRLPPPAGAGLPEQGPDHLPLPTSAPRTISARTFCYAGGIVDYVNYLNAEKPPARGPDLPLEGKKGRLDLPVAIQYTDSYTENVFSYVNNIPTGEGGTHETGFGRLYQGDERLCPPGRRCSRRRTPTWPARTSARA
ncbi:MAG: hypothetical protein V8Q82_06635 [Christensenellales bacterium]